MKEEVRLKRQLGLMHGVGIVAGLVIGSGIYISPQAVILHAGSVGLSLILWLVAGALSMLGALTYAEIGLVIPQSGALYAYMRTMFGRFAGFLYVWSYLFFVRVGSNAIKCLLFGRYVLKPFFPNCLVPDIAIKLIATTVGCCLTAINCFSVKLSARSQSVMTFTSIITLIVISISGLIWSVTKGTDNLDNAFEGTTFGIGDWVLAFYSTIYSYYGWYSLNFLVEELRNPDRNLPLSIVISVTSITVLFVFVNFTYFVVLGIDGVLQSEAVAVSVAARTMGPVALVMPVLIAVTACSSFNSGTMVGSRLSFAGARNGDLPSLLALINVKFFTPITSLVLQCTLTLVFIWTVEVYSLINNTIFVSLSFDVIVVVGFIRLRWTKRNEQSTSANQRSLKLPLAVPILYFLIVTLIVAVPLVTKPKESAIGLAMMLGTGAAYYLLVITWTNKPAVLVNKMAAFTRFIQKLFHCLPQDNPHSLTD